MSLKLTTGNQWPKVILITFFASLNIALNHFGYSIFESTQSPANLWLTLFFSIALFLPFLSLGRLFLLIVFLFSAFQIINELKLKFLNQPINQYDFEVILEMPFYWFCTIFSNQLWYYFVAILLSILLGFLISKNYRQCLFSALAMVIFYGHYSLFQKNLEQKQDEHDALASLVYSGSEAYFKNINSPLNKKYFQELVPEKEIEIAAKKYLLRTNNDLNPNIIFVLAESTFNPSDIFILRKNFRENSLFFDRKNEAYGKLEVPENKGGRWVSEFETISGISTKALGFDNHVNGLIASKIKTSFSRYLKEKNYHSTIFFPSLGEFINSKKTYKKFYGFDEIKNIKTPLLKSDKGASDKDLEMMKEVTKNLSQQSFLPFFSYIILSGNRQSLYCKREFLRGEDFRLVNDSSFDRNCEIDEYLKRTKSIESAMELLQDEMRKIEIKTGKPFLIVIFSDRQPWIFDSKSYDINRVKDASRYVTFYKVIKSDSLPLKKFPKSIPANLLPSLVSTALSTDVKGLYIPENFYLFEKCSKVKDVNSCRSSFDSQGLDYSRYFNF